MKTKFRPLADRILVQRLEESATTRSGIVLPDQAKEKSHRAKVISVGPGRLLDDGERSPIKLKAGDTVMLSKWGGTEFKLNGDDYVVVKEEDVLGIVE